MQRETGELKDMGLLAEELGKGTQKPEDWMDTGVTEGMEVSIGNIRCRVRKVTRKDIVLRPIPPGKMTPAQERQHAIDKAVSDAKGES